MAAASSLARAMHGPRLEASACTAGNTAPKAAAAEVHRSRRSAACRSTARPSACLSAAAASRMTALNAFW